MNDKGWDALRFMQIDEWQRTSSLKEGYFCLFSQYVNCVRIKIELGDIAINFEVSVAN